MLGKVSFMIGLLLAVVMGIIAAASPTLILAQWFGWLILLLVVLGIMVGFANVKDKEMTLFLVAVVALVISMAGTAGFMLIPYIGAFITAIITYIAHLMAPAAVVVGIKALMKTAKD